MYQILLLLGLLVRVLFIGVPGFKADVAFWKGWGLAVADKGIVWLVKNTNYNYPPGFAYILSLINHIYKLFANPYNTNIYWLDTNFFYLFLLKFIIIVSDFAIVFLIIKIARKFKMEGWGKILALFYLLSPAVIFDGVLWGQVDQFGILLYLLTIYLLLEERLNWAVIIFTLSWLMKWQNIVFIPIFYVFIYKKYSFEKLIQSLAVSFAAFFVVITPFWLNREMESLLNLFTINSNWFPWYSLNAFNGWWIASGLNGMGLSDKILVLGVINAKQFGLILFSCFYLLAVFNIFFAKKQNILKELILSSMLVVFAFFHLLTQSHERYLFPLLGLIPLLMLFEGSKKIKQTLNLLILVTVGSFLNMYVSMFYNYPDLVYWPFSAGFTKSFSLFLSVFQIAVFIYFFAFYFFDFIKKYYYLLIGVILLFFIAIFAINFNYIFFRPIPLTKITPTDFQQDYLIPVNNMTVESSRGPNYWNRLSDNYYFYKSGIGSHANSTIDYNLGGRFRKFDSDIGVDTEGGADAKVIYQVFGDGRLLYNSKPQGRYDLPKTLSVSITNVQTLTLKILKIGDSNSGDHADWLNPLLFR